MTLFAYTAEQIAIGGKAWVEAVTAILEAIIVKIGVLGLAAIAVYQNMKKQLPQEIVERLDRQSARLDRVAIATVAAAPDDKKVEVAAAVARASEHTSLASPVQTEPLKPEPEKPKPEPIIE